MSAQIDRPPAGVWLRYRLFGLRVQREWLPWVERDIGSRSWWMRTRGVWFLVIAGILLIESVASRSVSWWTVLALALGALFGLALTRLPGSTRVMDTERVVFLSYQRGERGYPWPGRRGDVPA